MRNANTTGPSSPNTQEFQLKQKPRDSQGSDGQAGACTAQSPAPRVSGDNLASSHSLPDPSANSSTLPKTQSVCPVGQELLM